MEFRDLTGQRFGKLVVLSEAPKTKNRSVRWLCKCDCGNTKIVRNRNLLDSTVTSCGCDNDYKDITGKVFNRLTVIKKVKVKGDKYRTWLCKCTCGNYIVVSKYNLKNGVVKSCGCMAREVRNIGNPIHKLYKTRINRIYFSMKARCYNKHHIHYKNYGERGITICDEWLGKNGFVNFAKWAIENGYNENLSIDRIDNSKGYSPENCKWSTPLEQQNNTRMNKHYIYKGKDYTLSQLARAVGKNVSTLSKHIQKTNSIEEAVNLPVQTQMRRTKKGK